jgi:hypothetical protein
MARPKGRGPGPGAHRERDADDALAAHHPQRRQPLRALLPPLRLAVDPQLQRLQRLAGDDERDAEAHFVGVLDHPNGGPGGRPHHGRGRAAAAQTRARAGFLGRGGVRRARRRVRVPAAAKAADEARRRDGGEAGEAPQDAHDVKPV